MKEVSCMALEIIFKELDKKNLSDEIMGKGINYNLDYLRNTKMNIEWDVFCKILSNTRTIWNDDDFIEIGTKLVEGKLPPVFSSLIGFFISIKGMYRLMTGTKTGIGTQYFRCIKTSYTDIDKDHVEILLELPAGYHYCTEFFLVTKGFFAAAPKLLKFNHSIVAMHETGLGALYKISLPQHNKHFTWFRQVLSFLSSKRAGIQTLNETYTLLYDRYNQLEENQAHMQKQAQQLETARSISNLIRSNLDLDFTLNAIAESLIQIADFASVEINVDWTTENGQVKRNVRKGIAPEKAKSLSRVLQGHGNSFGEIIICPHLRAPIEDAQHLLDYIISPITMEILNTFSFKLVNDYRRKLESKVDEIQRAIIEERRRISVELHDDLGTNLSAIALISSVIDKDLHEGKAGRISVIAQQSLDKINEIVWSLNPKNDNLENLIVFIRKYAMEYFEPTTIRCTVKLPNEIPNSVIKGEHRRNIFFAVKEALYNIIKHAQAAEVELNFSVKNNVLFVVIHDNGRGIPIGELNRFGNGLNNMQNRMKNINGNFSIENHEGTKITITVPV